MLSAPAYHVAIRDLVKTLDPKVWEWFGRRRNNPQAAEALRFELLKSTYRLSRDSHPRLYHAADRATEALQVALPVTLYQSQTDTLPNASLAFTAEDLHIVLTGNVDASLTDEELQALMAHEVGHHVLNELDDGDYWRTWDILRATCLDMHAHPAFIHSFRKLCLYNEIFCDRAALQVVADPHVVVSMLVKVTMGAACVDSPEFLRQTQEILDRLEVERKLGSEMATHPETYIRAYAIDQIAKQSNSFTQSLSKLIEGTIDVAAMDLLQQRIVSRATRQLLRRAFRHTTLRTDLMLSHAKLYFEDFDASENASLETCRELADLIGDPSSKEAMTTYFAYILLDFATADRSLDEFPLANSMQIAEEIGIKEAFLAIVRKELKLRKNQIEQCDRNKVEILQAANSAPSQT